MIKLLNFFFLFLSIFLITVHEFKASMTTSIHYYTNWIANKYLLLRVGYCAISVSHYSRYKTHIQLNWIIYRSNLLHVSTKSVANSQFMLFRMYPIIENRSMLIHILFSQIFRGLYENGFFFYSYIHAIQILNGERGGFLNS